MRSRVRRVLVALVALASVASGCTDDGGGPGPAAGEDDSAGSAAAGTSSEVGGEWESERVVSLPIPVTTDPSGSEPSNPDPGQLVYAGGVWLVTGDYRGRPTIWRSEDLAAWDVVYHEDRSGRDGVRRHVRWNTVVEFGDRIVAAGSGEEGVADRDRAFLFVSDDHGRSWTSLENPILTETDRRLDGIVVSGDSLIAELVVDRDGAEPQPIPHRTTDLETWEPIELPGARDDTWAWWTGDGRDLAVAVDTFRTGDDESTRIWWTRDGGASFGRAELDEPHGSVTVLPDGVLVVPAGSHSCCGFPDGPSPYPGQVWFHDGTAWALTDADVGQWGDGGGELRSPVVDPDTGRIHAFAARTLRADPHHCYVDVDTCRQFELALVTSTDGRVWVDETWPGVSDAPSWLAAPGGGQLVVWWRERDSSTLHFFRWTGPDSPPTDDPPGYDPVDAPVPFWDGEVLEVGDEYRYAVVPAGCGGMSVNEIDWVPDEEFDAVDWPTSDPPVADGQWGLVYGRIRLDAPDAMSFIVEGEGVVATFSPRTEPITEYCD